VVGGLVPAADARAEIRALGPTVGFLAAVLLLACLAERHGVFGYAGAVTARFSRGRPQRPPSLLLPVSNLTNLLAFAASGLTFAAFAGLMALPWLAVIAVEYVVLRLSFAADLNTPRIRSPGICPLFLRLGALTVPAGLVAAVAALGVPCGPERAPPARDGTTYGEDDGAGEVLGVADVHRLQAFSAPAGLHALEHEGLQVRAGGVERGGVAGRPRADGDQIADLVHGQLAGTRSASSFSTRVLISSRIGRTDSTPLPAGSSSFQSS
jgi:hypothetical protein